MTRPRLVTGARLRYDDVRDEHILLVPEGVVRLNPSAAEVLELCDGQRSTVRSSAYCASRGACTSRVRKYSSPAGSIHG